MYSHRKNGAHVNAPFANSEALNKFILKECMMRSGWQRNQDSRNTCEMLDIPLTLQSTVLLEKLTAAQPDDKLHNWYLVFCIAKKGHYSVRKRQQLGPLWATRIMPTPSPPLAFSIHFNIIVPSPSLPLRPSEKLQLPIINASTPESVENYSFNYP